MLCHALCGSLLCGASCLSFIWSGQHAGVTPHHLLPHTTSSHVTPPSAVLGPQFRGAASPASDLYGLGGTLLFLLSGRPPSAFPVDRMRTDFSSGVLPAAAVVRSAVAEAACALSCYPKLKPDCSHAMCQGWLQQIAPRMTCMNHLACPTLRSENGGPPGGGAGRPAGAGARGPHAG